MDRGNFYFITGDYYRKFHKEKLMINREVIDGQVHNRPCYYAFPDEEEQQIYWMVPVSSQTEKYILNQYFYADTGKPVTIPSDLRRELNAKVRKILRLAKRGKNLHLLRF